MQCCCFGGYARLLQPPPQKSLGAVLQDGDRAGLEKWLRTSWKVSANLRRSLLKALESKNPNAQTDDGLLPLHEAVRCQAQQLRDALLEAGASLQLRDRHGETALEIAHRLGQQIPKDALRRSSDRQTSDFLEALTLLPKVPVFSSLPLAELPKIAGAFVTRVYEPDAVIIEQGEVGNELFVLQKGKVSVSVRGAPDESPSRVATLGPGDYFGEAALLKNCPRNATVVATEKAQVKVLTRDVLQSLDIDGLHFPRRKAVRQGDEALGSDDEGLGHRILAQSAQDKNFIRGAMMKNKNLGALLDKVSGQDLEAMAARAYKMEVQRGTEVIKQGQVKADHFYIVVKGTFDVIKNGERVMEIGPGGSFGELALIFREPRAATVQATLGGVLWVLRRQDMRTVMQSQTKKKLEEFAALLERVAILKDVPDKRSIAEAMVEMTYYKGEYIIRQGEEGDSFYILYQGEVTVEINGKDVSRLRGDPSAGKADFFGERALLQEEPRAASIKVLSAKVRALVLDRDVFLAVAKRNNGRRKLGRIATIANMVEYSMDTLDSIGLLGCGGFGIVTLVKCRATGNTFALKALSKGHIVCCKQERAVMNEKAILRMTNSPFLVRLAATFNSGSFLYFLLEPALGGELFTVYEKHRLYGSETHAMFYAACVIKAFTHLHQRLIIYRDLKPENLLLDNKGYCKVADFGLAKLSIGHSYTTAGTPEFFAPEMILGSGHSFGVDCWALGVQIYEMMIGHTPFLAESHVQVFRKIQRGIEVLSFPRGNWPKLVKALCKQEPSERLSMRPGGWKNVEAHEWFAAANFNWEKLDARTLLAPYQPKVTSNTDTHNFAASMQDAPPFIEDCPDTSWDQDFEDRAGPALFL